MDEQTDGRTDEQRDEEVATQYSFVSLNMVLDKNVFRIETSKLSKNSSCKWTNGRTDGRTDAQRDVEVATQYSFVSLNMVWDKNVFRNENSKVSKKSLLFVTL